MNCCEPDATRRAKRVQITLLLGLVAILAVVALGREGDPRGEGRVQAGDERRGDHPAACRRSPGGLTFKRGLE